MKIGNRKATLLALITGISFILTTTIVCAAPPVPVVKTGQTTAYRTGDDGYYEKGVTSPSPRFTDNGDGTVTDAQTGLMWAKDANLAGGAQTWNAAIDFANSLSLGNAGCGSYYTDWRLPNVKEVQSLIDFGNHTPALPSGHPFITANSVSVQTSSTSIQRPTYNWGVNIMVGTVHEAQKIWASYVWPVRSVN
jgi:hypothetical protein